MVGKKHQCKTRWMCGVIKTKSREFNEHNKLLTKPLTISWFLSPNYEKNARYNDQESKSF
jgi:hypothetical protein